MTKKSKNIPKKKVSKTDAAIKKKASKAISRKKLQNMALALILLVTVAMGSALIYLNSAEEVPSYMKGLKELNDGIFKPQKTPAAVVNDVEISMKDFEERYSLIPPEYHQFISKEEVLEQMIEETLLLQEASKAGITATDEEIDAYLNNLLFENQITMEEFLWILEERDMSLEQVKKFYVSEILLNKLIEEKINSRIVVSEGDINNFYLSNMEYFLIPESINVSHIMICHESSIGCPSELTKEEALSLSQEIRGKITRTNFGLLALEYSDDLGSKESGGILPMLISKEDNPDDNFYEAATNLSLGGVSGPVETLFGYHIIKLNERVNASTIELDAVREMINQTLYGEAQQELLMDYMEQLRENAQVIVYLN
jgi:parvulin-like peptidyl-prolyl isomerase